MSDEFKLRTRRYLAWWTVGCVVVILSAVGLIGAWRGDMELVTISVPLLGSFVSLILGLYFGKQEANG